MRSQSHGVVPLELGRTDACGSQARDTWRALTTAERMEFSRLRKENPTLQE
jgi:hypothetical protein